MDQFTDENKPESIKLNLESPFECNICLELAEEPVLTTCGHLFCWPCIYSWFNSNQEFLTCPVCKNGVELKSLVPLYTKTDSSQQNKRFRDPNIPPRPKQERIEPIRNQNAIGAGLNNGQMQNVQNGIMIAGYGLFPSLFNLMEIENGQIDLDEIHENEDMVERKFYPKLIWVQRIVLALLVFTYLLYI